MVLQVSPGGIKEGEKNGFCLGSCPCIHTLNKGILRTDTSKSQEKSIKAKIKSSDWIAMLPLPMPFLEHFGMKMFHSLVLAFWWGFVFGLVFFVVNTNDRNLEGTFFPWWPQASGSDGATTGREERGSCVPSLMGHHTLVASMVIRGQHRLDVQSGRREKREKSMEAHLTSIDWLITQQASIPMEQDLRRSCVANAFAVVLKLGTLIW